MRNGFEQTECFRAMTCSGQPLAYCLVFAILVWLCGSGPVLGQSITWTAPQATSGIQDIDLSGGNTLYALNGGSSSLNVGGIAFDASNFANLPPGVSFSPTGGSSGSTPGAGTFSDIYGGSMISTGNSNYDQLIDSFSWSAGSSGGISNGNFVFGGLTPGNQYQIQVWYNEQRVTLDDRVMRFGDALGGNVELAGGDPAPGVQGNAYGQYSIGTFTAAGSSQNLSLESLGFSNVHYNAILLRDTEPVDPGPVSDPPDPKLTPGWVIDSQDEWYAAAASDATQFTLSNGLATPTHAGAIFESHVQRFTHKQRFETLTLAQTPQWGAGKWESSGNLGPSTEFDAPVFVSPAEGEYYYLNRNNSGPIYHVWSSPDMVNWTDHGPVTGQDWVTSAEYHDGTFYIYYDEPNDENPHLMTFTDLTDASTRVDHGEVLDNESHGSDMAAFRDLDGSFHIIYEDWSAINARQHSWDSQYAGHTSSPDGINGFTAHEHTPPIDRRGNPTGQILQYNHPNGTYQYEVHDGSLDAWGDYELIRVGDTYYLFADDHPEGSGIGLGYWYSDDLYGEFTYGGKIRDGMHPDPTAGFAEGEFVMFVQGPATGAGQDLTSSGPWVDGVEAQAGVDTDGDGEIDVWTEWQDVSEQYSRIDGFAKAYAVDPADLDLSGLPDGFGIQFRIRTNDTAAVFDSVIVESTTLATAIPGDYNNDGIVDAADYVVWRDNLGAPAGTLLNDIDGGEIGQNQYSTWRANFGAVAPPDASLGDANSVPEPTTWITLVAGVCIAIVSRALA